MGSRVYVYYGGREYSVAGERVDEVRSQIESVLATGTPGWLEVNFGEGQPNAAQLLLTPGVPLELHQVTAPTDAELDAPSS